MAKLAVLALLVAVVVGCGGSSDKPAATGAPSQPSAQQRAGQLLDDWSTTLLTTLQAAQRRGQAAQTSDQGAYSKADGQLRPGLRKVKRFASQGRTVMSQFPEGELRRAVVADGDAWQEWALALDRSGEISLKRARKIADLGAVAFSTHERAYKAAGKKPPPEFQRRSDQR